MLSRPSVSGGIHSSAVVPVSSEAKVEAVPVAIPISICVSVIVTLVTGTGTAHSLTQLTSNIAAAEWQQTASIRIDKLL